MKIPAAKKLQRDMWRCLLLGTEFVPDPSFTDADGYWHPQSAEKPKAHPLDAVLLAETVDGDWRHDVAQSLNVSEEFVDGFVRGFANRPENDFVAGIMDGVQARLLLDRLPHIWEQMEAEDF